MSNCSNCYNGCTEIVSDRCVKYTGIDVPVLGIQTGDSLSFVEQALITFLVSTLDGTGIKINLDPVVVCNVVNKYLPTCGDLSIVDISKALIQAACDLQEQIDAIVAELAVLNADYNVGCLTGVTASSDTHAIVQAVITKLCQLEVDLIALASDLHTNYVTKTSINDYIAAYINGETALVSAKMIPYVAVPFFPTPAFLSGKFDGTGAGIGTWAKVYLCNGANPGVPDLRGRVLVGATSGMNGGAMNPAVNPGGANPNYFLGTITGANEVTLLPTQIPSHTHAATAVSTVTDPKHKHDYITPNANGSATGAADNHPDGPLVTKQTSESATGITVATTVTNAPTGGGLAHPNNQPAYGCYYIIYIP